MSSDIDFAAHMQAVATALLGKPNPHLSKGTVLRFGTNGSMSVDIEKGTFYSHEDEDGDGGGVRHFIKREKGLEGAEAIEFMRQSGCDVSDSRRMGNGTNGTHYSSAAKSAVEAKPEIEATFDYTDEKGQLLFQVVRKVFRKPDGTLVMTPQGKPEKKFLQRHRDPKTGVWLWNVQGIRIVPYKLPELLKAIAVPRTVFLVEGEKKVDALREAGLQATCSPMGAGKWRAEFAPYFAGAFVVILPDNDGPGRDHGEQIAASLHGTAKSVKVLTLPDLPHKGDVIDWLAAGHNAVELKNLVAKAPAWAPPAENQEAPRTESAPSATHGAKQRWQEPKPLPSSLLPVKAFDLALLPEKIAPWVADIADRMQCPPDFVGVPALVALGTVIGRRIGVRPQRRTDWIEVPNLWACLVGRPGMLKSPAMSEALKPLQRLEAEARKSNDEARKDHAAALEAHKLKVEAARAAAKKALQGAGNPIEMLRLDEPEAPKDRRYIANDCTYEALGEILVDNPNGVLAFRDELVSLLKTLDREEYAAARGFFLTAWGGTSGYTFDRIIRGRRHIEAACVGMLGSTQPAKLAEYVRRAVSGGAGDDGMIQRFGMLVWPDGSPEWANVDRYPDSAARQSAWGTFDRLDKLIPDDVGAVKDQFEALPFLRFDDEAQEIFDQWRQSLEARLRSSDLHPALESHLAKYRKLVPSLALLCALADGSTGAIDAGSCLRALALAEYLESHARRVYGAGSEAETAAAKALLLRIRRGDLADGFTCRMIHQRDWSNLSDPEQVQAGLDLLVDNDWIVDQTAKSPGGGRAKTSYSINPKARQ
jgi:hypothetical protein